jgi:hypothetical protein
MGTRRAQRTLDIWAILAVGSVLAGCVEVDTLAGGPTSETGGSGGRGGGGTGGTSTAVSLEDAVDLIDAAAAKHCDCVEADEVERCLANAAVEGSMVLSDCETEALSVSAAQPALQCLADLARTYLQCVDESGCVTEELSACANQYEREQSACDMPSSVSLALEDCYFLSGGVFTCSNGDVIPVASECDGWEDCLDGTDEMGC